MRNRRERVARGIQAAPGGLFLVRSPGGDVFPPPGHKYPGRDERRREKWVIFVNVNTSLTRERGEGLTADLNDMTASETMETTMSFRMENGLLTASKRRFAEKVPCSRQANAVSRKKHLAHGEQAPFRGKSALLTASKRRFAEKVPCSRRASAVSRKKFLAHGEQASFRTRHNVIQERRNPIFNNIKKIQT